MTRSEQARKHARDRRARAIANEEESKRELQAVQAELIKAEVFTDTAIRTCASDGSSSFVPPHQQSGFNYCGIVVS